MVFEEAYRGKTVLVTGHTGFKGSWLCEWLLMMGAEVIGYALEPPSQPSHFDVLGLTGRLKEDVRADIRDFDTLRKTYERHRPDYVFHLAAQPIVRRGFTEPAYTIETNVVGTMNVLETLRVSAYDCIAILITTDKVYENVEWVWAYRENDALGGHDPYSASKSCAEVLISTYQRSFFEMAATDAPKIHAASVRGGNVIGGGDWA
ncbi:MAG: CDP-glucose 4,6-dehydratase, partial [Bacteroidota bacterium]